MPRPHNELAHKGRPCGAFRLRPLSLAVIVLLGLPALAAAQTRFYLPSTGTATPSPAFGSGWGTTTNADRMKMVKTRISSAMTSKNGAGTAATDHQLLRQYVYEAETLSGQTLTGSIKGQVRLSGTNTNVGRLAIRLFETSTDGATVNQLLAITNSADTTIPPQNAVDPTNRRLEEGSNDFAINYSFTTTSGYYLGVELGYKDESTNATRAMFASFGDNSATDLAEDETTTTADNPWVEFTDTISFGGGAAAPTPRLLLLGIGDLLALTWHMLWTVAYGA